MDDHTLNIINAVSGAFAAIGTVAAVIVALALARRDEGLRLGINVATGGIVVRGHGRLVESRFEVLISIANLGRRPVQMTAVGWTLGYFREQYLMQVFDPDPHGSNPPTKLGDGDSTIYVVPIAKFETDFPPHVLKLPWLERRLVLRSIRLVVHTSAGKNFSVKPHPTLLTHIRQLLRGVAGRQLAPGTRAGPAERPSRD